MYKVCRTEKSLSRQRELENGFLEYLDTVSFLEIEISDLCRHLNIPRKTFYRYFGSKEDALYSLVDHRFADLNRYVQEKQKQMNTDHRENALLYFSFWKEQKRFLDILVKNYLVSVLMARAVMPLNMPAECLYTPMVEKDSPDNYIFNFWSTGTLAMMLQWYASGFQKDVGELADITSRLLNSR